MVLVYIVLGIIALFFVLRGADVALQTVQDAPSSRMSLFAIGFGVLLAAAVFAGLVLAG